MIFIKKISEDNVLLGGQVATQEMINDGWFSYDGPIPQSNHLKLVDGVLVEHAPELPTLMQIDVYKEYLNNTDFKMLPGYVPKEGENLEDIKTKRDIARQYIRDNDPKILLTDL